MRNLIEHLNLEDDFLFAKVMMDAEICRRVLETILKIPIKKISIPTTQRTIDILLESKGVRLDVYVDDDEDTVFNAEMERSKKRELPKRSRYYQGNIDLDLISTGQPYTALKKSFIIFICTFDPFDENRCVYTFKNICEEDHQLQLGDETTKIFLNTTGDMTDLDIELKEFLMYIQNSTDEFASSTKGTLVKEIHKRVSEVRQSKEMEVEYMTLFQRDMENRELGREEGKEESLKIFIRNMLNRGMSDEDICALAECTKELIDEVRNS